MFFVVQIILALTLQAILLAKHNIVKVTLKIVIPLHVMKVNWSTR